MGAVVRRVALVLSAAVAAAVLVQPAWAVSPAVVVSQVYGGGGNTGATYTNDFVELFNRGSTSVSVVGWSVQYGSATGNTWQATNLSGSIAPGQYYLVQEAQGAAGTTPLPTPNATGTIAMAATAGKIALVNNTTALSGACPTSASIVDLVGYGSTANCFEGTGPAPAPSNTTADLRNGNGCTETDANPSDFTAGSPNPRNAASPLNPCSGGDTAPSVSSTTPSSGASGVATNANVSITFSEPVNVAPGWFSIVCGTTGSHTVSVTGGPTTFTLDPAADFVVLETCTVTIVAADVTDQDLNDPPDNMSADYVFSFTTATPAEIHDIQGAAHISPLNGSGVSGVRGIVIARLGNGFFMQDPTPDADSVTSEGIFVFTSTAPSVVVGDDVSVSGIVSEFRAGGATAANLTQTELTSPSIVKLSTGNPLPAATIVGVGGVVPPTTVIEDDASGDVELSSVFDPASDGIDFYESLESMRVQVNNPVAVGPTSSFGELPVLADDGGSSASVRTTRGGIVVRPTDFNPERVILDDDVLLSSLAGTLPIANVGDHLSGPALGVVSYTFGNFKLELTGAPATVSAGLTRETTSAAAPGEVSIATFNLENLDPGDGSRFGDLAGIIVNRLLSPDVVAVEEIQDNNGALNDSVVDASATYNTLISAITTAGGPSYQFRQIDPVDDQDGGEPGGNIRVGFLFRTGRGLAFVDRPGGTSTAATGVVNNAGTAELSLSPGRIDPTNPAFNASRKPLAGEFTFGGKRFFVIVNHFNSKGGDQPLFGRFQPPVLASEAQRIQQAQVVNNFVDSILAVQADAAVVVLGDLNDFEFSAPLTTLKGGVLTDFIGSLPQAERYDYVFEGNSQALDHILATVGVTTRPLVFDVVHVDSEFAVQASDHDPEVLRFDPIDSTTAVSVRSFSAVRRGVGVVLLWRTSSELGLVGFDVYRQHAGRSVRVNRITIPARTPGGLRGHAYSWRDRASSAGARYRLRLVSLDGSRRWGPSAVVG